MISEDSDGGGFLINQDKCIHVGSEEQSSNKVKRTVCIFISSKIVVSLIYLFLQETWEFISIALLQNRKHEYEILDDLESALHYTAYSRHANIGLLIDPYDEVKIDWDGTVVKGQLKSNIIYHPLKVLFHLPVLHTLIEEFCAWFDECYRILECYFLIFSEKRDGKYFRCHQSLPSQIL